MTSIELHIAMTANVKLSLVRQYIVRGYVRVDGVVITPEQGKQEYTGQDVTVNNKGTGCLSDLNYTGEQMTPQEYKLATRETAIYPKEVALPYLVLGLVSEADELGRAITSGDTGNIVKEAGDNLWYTFRLYDEMFHELAAVDQWQDFYPSWKLNTDGALRKINSAIGSLADMTKKAIRDNNGVIPEGKRNDFMLALSQVVTGIAHIDVNTLEYYAIANIEKLMSRKQRNVIKGSGDDR